MGWTCAASRPCPKKGKERRDSSKAGGGLGSLHENLGRKCKLCREHRHIDLRGYVRFARGGDADFLPDRAAAVAGDETHSRIACRSTVWSGSMSTRRDIAAARRARWFR